MNFAIIGCGLIGKKRAQNLGNCNLLYVCDSDLNRANQLSIQYDKCKPISDYSIICSDKDVESVIVSVTNNQLFPISLELIEAGKHVLIEKPGGLSVNELEILHSESIKNNCIVRIGYNHRYHPACLKAKQLINDPDFGEIMFLRGRYGHGGRLGYEKEWRSDKNLSGGGELIDQGVHLIDLSNMFIENLNIIDGHIHTYFWNMEVEDNAFISLQNQKGNTAWLHVSCTEWKNTFSLEIYGKNAKLHWEGLGGSYGIERLTYYKMLPEMGPPETIIYEYPMVDNSWKIENQEFIKDVKLKRQSIPGLIEGIKVLKVVERLYKKDL